MRTKIIKIGNSRGVRLPKAFIEDFNLNDEVELERFPDFIAFKPVLSNRKNWEAAFMQTKSDSVIDDINSGFNFSNEFDNEEWVMK